MEEVKERFFNSATAFYQPHASSSLHALGEDSFLERVEVYDRSQLQTASLVPISTDYGNQGPEASGGSSQQRPPPTLRVIYCPNGGLKVRLTQEVDSLVIKLSFWSCSGELLSKLNRANSGSQVESADRSSSEVRFRLACDVVENGYGWITLSQDLFVITQVNGVVSFFAPKGVLVLTRNIFLSHRLTNEGKQSGQLKACQMTVSSSHKQFYVFSESGELFRVTPKILPSGRLITTASMLVRFQVGPLEQQLCLAAATDPFPPLDDGLADSRFFFSEVHETGRAIVSVVSNDNLVIFALSAGDLYVVLLSQMSGDSTPDDVSSLQLVRKSLHCSQLALSSTSEKLACFTSDGMIVVFSRATDLDAELLKVDLFAVKGGDALSRNSQKAIPEQFLWCGTDFITSYWSEVGLFLLDCQMNVETISSGSSRDKHPWILLKYQFPIVLVQELASVSVHSEFSVELLRSTSLTRYCFSQLHLESSAAVPCEKPGYLAYYLLKTYEKFQRGDLSFEEDVKFLIDSAAGGRMRQAFEECLLLASGEFAVSNQHALLQCVTFGKGLLESAESLDSNSSRLWSTYYTCFLQELSELCTTLRLLNALRHEQIGMPVTYLQFQHMTFQDIVLRLMSRNLHFFVLQILDALLRLSSSSTKSPTFPREQLLNLRRIVLQNWAQKKTFAEVHRYEKHRLNTISTEKELMKDLFLAIDEKLADKMSQSLYHFNAVISYGKLALAADSVGKRYLAQLFLAEEKVLLVQVAVCLQLRMYQTALKTVEKTYDANLIELILLFYLSVVKDGIASEKALLLRHDMKEFYVKLFTFYCSKFHAQFLKTFLYERKDVQNTALIIMSEASEWRFGVHEASVVLRKRLKNYGIVKELEASTMSGSEQASTVTSLSQKVSSARASSKVSSTSRRYPLSLTSFAATYVPETSSASLSRTEEPLESSLSRQQIKLLEYQQELVASTDEQVFLGLSLYQTLFHCFTLGLSRNAVELRGLFQLSASVFYRTKLRALGELGDWQEFKKLVLLRTSSSRLNSKITTLSYTFDMVKVVELCIYYENRDLAHTFAQKVVDLHQRMTLFLDLKAYEEAAELAIQLNDVQAAKIIANNCKEKRVITRLAQHLAV